VDCPSASQPRAAERSADRRRWHTRGFARHGCRSLLAQGCAACDRPRAAPHPPDGGREGAISRVQDARVFRQGRLFVVLPERYYLVQARECGITLPARKAYDLRGFSLTLVYIMRSHGMRSRPSSNV
jgi:hypothetical protein